MAIPVTRDAAKQQLRIEADDGEQDELIDGYIADAAAWVENYTGHTLTARDMVAELRSFSDSLPGWPIKRDVVLAVSYGATPTTITGARINLRSRPARLVQPLALASWPALGGTDAIAVAYRAGYEAGDTVPRNLRRAMLVLIAGYDADREGGEVLQAAEATARRLCSDFRCRRL